MAQLYVGAAYRRSQRAVVGLRKFSSQPNTNPLPSFWIQQTQTPVEQRKRDQNLRTHASKKLGIKLRPEEKFIEREVSEEFKALQADVNHINWARRKMYYAPHIEEIARSLSIPNPNFKKSKRDMLVFGRNNGSMRINTSGDTVGLWYDFEEGKGGHIIDLISHTLGLGTQDAVRYADSFVTSMSLEIAEKMVNETVEDKCHIGVSNSTSTTTMKLLLKYSKPLQKHPLDYLIKTRKITDPHRLQEIADLRSLPAHVVPHQDCPCLLAICRDSSGEITGGQMTYINTRTLRKAKHVEVDKRSIGNVMQSFVCLQKGTNHTVALAEGVETGLSVASAFPSHSVYASLGLFNMLHFSSFISDVEPETERVLLCADHDQNSGPQNLILKCFATLKRDFPDTFLLKPESPGDDFNDVLQKRGIVELKEMIDQLIENSQPVDLTNLQELFNVPANYRTYCDDLDDIDTEINYLPPRSLEEFDNYDF